MLWLRGDRAEMHPGHREGQQTMRALVDMLRQVPYFAELETRPLRGLAALVRERKYRTREAILLEGEPCEGLNVLLSGGRGGDGEVA